MKDEYLKEIEWEFNSRVDVFNEEAAGLLEETAGPPKETKAMMEDCAETVCTQTRDRLKEMREATRLRPMRGMEQFPTSGCRATSLPLDRLHDSTGEAAAHVFGYSTSSSGARRVSCLSFGPFNLQNRAILQRTAEEAHNFFNIRAELGRPKSRSVVFAAGEVVLLGCTSQGGGQSSGAGSGGAGAKEWFAMSLFLCPNAS